MTICETAIVDSRSGSISLINCLEEIVLHGLPAAIPKLAVVVQAESDDEDTEQQFSCELLISSATSEILRQPVVLNFAGKKRARIILEMNGMPIKEASVLNFRMSEGENNIIERLISIKVPETIQAAVAQV